MRKSFEAMAQRAVNAENAFVVELIRAGGISETDAVKVMNLYLKEKIAKLDYGIGRINVKHGAFWERDVIRRAANL